MHALVPAQGWVRHSSRHSIGLNSTTRHFPCQQSLLRTRCCKVAWPVRATGLGRMLSDGSVRPSLLRRQATLVAGWVALPARPVMVARESYPRAVAMLLPHPCAISATMVLAAIPKQVAYFPTTSCSVRCDPWVDAPGARRAGAVRPAAALLRL